MSYAYPGARVLVELHALHMREFLATWREFDARALPLPATSSPDYASREALLTHVLRCAASYLTWICEKMEIPAPPLDTNPSPKGFAARADAYLEQVLAAWDGPLRGITEEQAEAEAYPSRWGPPYTVDAMLEHAVMHPIRHSAQLRALMGG